MHVIAAVALLAACTTEAPRDPADTHEPNDTAPPEDTASAGPWPAEYSDVAVEYEALRSELLAGAIPAIDLFWAGELDTLYDGFSDELKVTVTREDLQRYYDRFVGGGAVGEATETRVIAFGRELQFVGRYPWEGGTDDVKVFVGLDAQGDLDTFAVVRTVIDDELPYSDFESDVTFTLPLDGLSSVLWGGQSELENRNNMVDRTAWAYDFLVWADGGTCDLPCAAVEDYHIYGRPILAPAPGEVVTARDGYPDFAPGESSIGPAYGNLVVLQVAPGEYLMMAIMRTNSVAVAVGDHVERGQIVGAVGNSGNSTEQNLWIQLIDRPQPDGAAQGMPMRFSDIVVDGVPEELGMPIGGTFVSPR